MSLTVINAFALAAPAASSKAYRYVGVHFVQGVGTTFMGGTQLSMFETGSSTDHCLAGTMGFTGSGNPSYPPSNLNDNNTSTLATSNSNQAILGTLNIYYCDFGSGNTKRITKVGWRSRPSFLENPAVWRVVGRNSTSDPWEHIAYLPSDYGWTAGEYKEFSYTPVADGSALPGYRYIRLNVTATQVSGWGVQVDELRFIASPEGDLKSNLFWNAITDSNNTGSPGSNTMDNNTGIWSASVSAAYVTYDYGANLKVNPTSFGIRHRAGVFNSAPKDFTILGSDDPTFATYTTLLTVTGYTGWTDGVFSNF